MRHVVRNILGALGVVAVIAGIAATTAGATTAATTTGTRVTVGLFGDSVTEGIVIPNFEHDGLAPTLARTVAGHYGLQLGGPGLIPAQQYQWTYNGWGLAGRTTTPPNGWTLTGTAIGAALTAGVDGPSGYSATTTSPQATATTTVDEPDVEVLYDSTPNHCTFDVTLADSGSVWTIDTYAPGAAHAAETEITLPSGTHSLTVHGSDCGLLTFSGIVEQKPLPAKGVQIEVDNDGHSAQMPFISLGPRIQQAIALQRYDISVFLYAYIAEGYLTPGKITDEYESSVLTRARIAREHGGSCVIAAPAPLPLDADSVKQATKIDQSIARKAGCEYTTVLTHIWPSPAYAVSHGWVVVDGIHPTAIGYRIMARALAPVIEALVRKHS